MAPENVILYHYSYSPYARRVAWYLTLRGIPYAQCMQPPTMPRPDVARLGIEYRRIPILSIGRDVYLDTRLQLIKLEEMEVSLPRLGAERPDQRAVERLLSRLMTDGGVFGWAASLLPRDMPLLKDPAFQKDRAEFFGSQPRPDPRHVALREVASVFGLLETTLLADGRDWVLGTPAPGLADIEAVWPLHWLAGVPGALPGDVFGPRAYPRVYAWIRRFEEAVRRARGRAGRPRTVGGEEAQRIILGSGYHEAEGRVDGGDPEVVALGLAKGDVVTVGPTDFGAARRDVGRLVGLDADEVVYETETETGAEAGARGRPVRVHAPRHGFRIHGVREDGVRL
ncbi:Glutathione S-transferase, protein [Metarhizium album ARSEF 1941]|uniref:Glutathione S-transferase, protein n=1 Tax=Metarhizium album (strain ARSEF 1941) TaxID=1081103 RepID=A0A0B2WTJ7_METAS|nr:Glutathione S-transferase, protein [Metarhizium album ARSEF 1941]KHN96989.1 Glutathione S-transferase, protein [Metarhizium album ARSEF 1941]